MKGTDNFKAVIKDFLDRRGAEDALFKEKYETSGRTIDDVVTYILNQVKATGCCGFSDDEIFSMAVHVIDEPEIEIGRPIGCHVVVNRHIELTEEEKVQQKALAMQRFQEQELAKLKSRAHSSKSNPRRPADDVTPSLFDF